MGPAAPSTGTVNFTAQFMTHISTLAGINRSGNQSPPHFCYFKVENEVLLKRQALHRPHFDFMFWTSRPHHCHLISGHPADGEDVTLKWRNFSDKILLKPL